MREKKLKDKDEIIKKTKAKTLEFLKNKLTNAIVFDQISFNLKEWRSNSETILGKINQKGWFDQKLIVRSSALCEDGTDFSHAGRFESLLNINGEEKISKAINRVFKSFNSKIDQNQVFIQPMLEDVKISGVVFTRDPNNNSPYLRINFDDRSGRTDSITSGISNNTKVFYHHRLYKKKYNDFKDKIIRLSFELETKLNEQALDFEFGINESDDIVLFQVRPLIIKNHNNYIDDESHFVCLSNLSKRIGIWLKKHPYLFGTKGLFGIMPDWNPAEIIGIKPSPFSLSLYREVVTNSVWAYQRDNYGYSNLRSFPLLVEFEGMPYIDVRVSFNSFIPKSLNKKIAEKLVNFYLEKLRSNPRLHDKVEFEVIFSCFTLDLKEKIKILKNFNFSAEEIGEIESSLLKLTNNLIANNNSVWQKDIEKISTLQKRYKKICKSDLDNFSKIYWLIEDCKRYGTLPFAGLARVGFIAVEILKSMVKKNLISENEYDCFLQSLETVSTSITNDFNLMNKKEFLEIYGHLRPGTYDILSKSYKENYDVYFNSKKKKQYLKKNVKFLLRDDQHIRINEHLKSNGLSVDSRDLFIFLKKSIEAREYAKFIFTKNISAVLELYKKTCIDLNISLEDASFTHISSIMSLNSIASDPRKIINSSIKRRKDRYELTKLINLPPLVVDKNDVFSFNEAENTPNFITQKKIAGQIIFLNNQKINISGKIVAIENADPGFDWIFSHKILGLVTKYGGINSHMSIRSAELGIPAVIGVGDLFEKFKEKDNIIIDCLLKIIK